MLRVLRHYLPIRKALLIFSETLLLSLVLTAGMSAHLAGTPDRNVIGRLVLDNIGSLETAFLRCSISAVLLAVLAQVAIAFNELYDFRVSSSRYARSAKFVESAGSAIGLSLLVLVLVHAWRLETVLDFPGLSLGGKVRALVFSLLVGFGLLYLWRNLFHYLLRQTRLDERVLILGSGKTAHELAQQMLERPDSGYEVVALVPDTTAALASARAEGEVRESARLAAGDHPRSLLPGFPRPEADREPGTPATRALVIEPAAPSGAATGAARSSAATGGVATAENEDSGSPAASEREVVPPAHSTLRLQPGETLYDLVSRLKIDVVAVALSDRRRRLPTDELLRCRLAGISVREQEALYEGITGKIAVEALRPSYLIFNEGFSYHPWAELAKRLLDVTVAVVLLALAWPIMIAAAIAIRLDSAGPALFTQERLGRDGKPFTLFKFRSMRADAEQQTGPVWATAGDPRITRIGGFLRKSRIDELPQLFNVLAGTMSLVGPRPERPHFVDELAQKIPYFRQRHIVKPGVTGWAQINYPYGNTFEDAVQKLQYDLFYIKNQSLLFDLSILFNTIKTVVLRKGT